MSSQPSTVCESVLLFFFPCFFACLASSFSRFRRGADAACACDAVLACSHRVGAQRRLVLLPAYCRDRSTAERHPVCGSWPASRYLLSCWTGTRRIEADDVAAAAQSTLICVPLSLVIFQSMSVYCMFANVRIGLVLACRYRVFARQQNTELGFFGIGGGAAT